MPVFWWLILFVNVETRDPGRERSSPTSMLLFDSKPKHFCPMSQNSGLMNTPKLAFILFKN